MTSEPNHANHHLWRNRRMWWVAFSVVHDGIRQERIRCSLSTHDVEVARRRRDEVMRDYARRPGVEVSVRRIAVRPRRAAAPRETAAAPPDAPPRRDDTAGFEQRCQEWIRELTEEV